MESTPHRQDIFAHGFLHSVYSSPRNRATAPLAVQFGAAAVGWALGRKQSGRVLGRPRLPWPKAPDWRPSRSEVDVPRNSPFSPMAFPTAPIRFDTARSGMEAENPFSSARRPNDSIRPEHCGASSPSVDRPRAILVALGAANQDHGRTRRSETATSAQMRAAASGAPHHGGPHDGCGGGVDLTAEAGCVQQPRWTYGSRSAALPVCRSTVKWFIQRHSCGQVPRCTANRRLAECAAASRPTGPAMR